MLVEDALDTLLDSARTWAAADPDPETRAEAEDLISRVELGDTDARAELTDAFAGRLAFGTAGLRGRLGAGPRRMNRVVIAQTSAGFAAFLHDRANADAAAGSAPSAPSVVIGYDGRVNSAVFARDAAEVLAGAGLRVTLLPEPMPTPVTAFAVRFLDASAGVMVTASHNPPRDNGYKVYLGGADRGSQIAPPVDCEIAERIAQAATGPHGELPRSDDYAVAGPEVLDAYVSQTAEALRAGFLPDPETPSAPAGFDADLSVSYTAMHGVGSRVAVRVFAAAGLPAVASVPEQDQPDGEFPTVSFPNPEEPGSLDLAYRTAREIDADLVVAHDPDADRLAIALPHAAEETGYRRLTGNELGLLLGWRAAERARVRAARAGARPEGTLACTIVSSPALRAVAREYGLDYTETLSGFKWVSRVPGLVFGFEESLGYLTHPEVVGDKDGISASADAIAMVRELKSAGTSVWELLEEASMRFGHFASEQVMLRFDSMAEAEKLSQRIRSAPPSDFDGIVVTSAQDLLQPNLAAVPANVLRYDLSDGSRIMVRPSGTEPKLKIYIDAFSDRGTAEDRRTDAEQVLARIESAVREYVDRLLEEGKQ